MIAELERIAQQCDGIRCDMAMLVLPQVFEKTWGIDGPAFWPRATEAVRAKVAEHRAAAILTFLTPGLRFFQQGQREGKRVRIPVHLGRGPIETPEATIAAFYDGGLQCLKDPAWRDGDWQLLACQPAWDGNGTWDSFVAFAWTGPGQSRRLVAVNYADDRGQCYVTMPWHDLQGLTWRLEDLTGPAVYDRQVADVAKRGLYLDMPAWGYHVFAVSHAV